MGVEDFLDGVSSDGRDMKGIDALVDCEAGVECGVWSVEGGFGGRGMNSRLLSFY